MKGFLLGFFILINFVGKRIRILYFSFLFISSYLVFSLSFWAQLAGPAVAEEKLAIHHTVV